MASINASTSGGGGVITTADSSGNLNIQSGGSTVVAVTATGVAVTGTLAATGAITGSSTVAGSTGILYPLTSGTAVASTSGTSIDFTSIPSWVKRITMMFVGVSTNGTSVVQVQLGTSGGIVTTAYKDMVGLVTTAINTTRGAVYTSGFALATSGAAIDTWNGTFTFSLFGSNTWTLAGNVYSEGNQNIAFGAGSLALGGTLDRVRLTTVNGTDTFDAGSVNILYE